MNAAILMDSIGIGSASLAVSIWSIYGFSDLWVNRRTYGTNVFDLVLCVVVGGVSLFTAWYHANSLLEGLM